MFFPLFSGDRPIRSLVLDREAPTSLIAAVKAFQRDLEDQFGLRLSLIVGPDLHQWPDALGRPLIIGEYASFLTPEWADWLPDLPSLGPIPGAEGFAIGGMASEAEGKRNAVCLGGSKIGTRHGLIEIRRRLRHTPQGIGIELPEVATDGILRKGPRYPFRCLFVFAAANSPAGQEYGYYAPGHWGATDWQRYIEMLAFFRFNVLGLGVCPPPLAWDGAPEEAPELDQYFDLLRHIIWVAHEAGLQVLVQAPPHGYLGGRQLCPTDAEQRERMERVDTFFIRNLREADFFELFPGPLRRPMAAGVPASNGGPQGRGGVVGGQTGMSAPPGCNCGRCNEGTFLELALRSAERISQYSDARIVLNTWMAFHAWGAQWTDREVSEALVRRLGSFPPDMRVAVGERTDDEWICAIAQTHRLLAANGDTESEHSSDPVPQFRLRTVQRHLLARVSPYSGFDGAIYNMHAPALGLLNCYGAAELLWDPSRSINTICTEFAAGLGAEESAEVGRALRDIGTVYSKDDRYDYQEGSGPRLTLEPADLPVTCEAQEVLEAFLQEEGQSTAENRSCATLRSSGATLPSALRSQPVLRSSEATEGGGFGGAGSLRSTSRAWPLFLSPAECISSYRAAAQLYRRVLPAAFLMNRLLNTPRTPENRPRLDRLVAELRQCELEKVVPSFYERCNFGERAALWEVYEAYRFWLQPEAILGPNLAGASLGAVAKASSVFTHVPPPSHSPRLAEEPPAQPRTFKHAIISHLNDGLYGPSSLWISGTPGRGWVTVDLGDELRCDRLVFSRNRPLVEVNPHDYMDGLPRDFTVEVSSDGRAWTPVLRVADNVHNRAICRFPSPVLARYVRLNILATVDGKRPCLDELEVFDTGEIG